MNPKSNRTSEETSNGTMDLVVGDLRTVRADSGSKCMLNSAQGLTFPIPSTLPPAITIRLMLEAN